MYHYYKFKANDAWNSKIRIRLCSNIVLCSWYHYKRTCLFLLPNGKNIENFRFQVETLLMITDIKIWLNLCFSFFSVYLLSCFRVSKRLGNGANEERIIISLLQKMDSAGEELKEKTETNERTNERKKERKEGKREGKEPGIMISFVRNK